MNYSASPFKAVLLSIIFLSTSALANVDLDFTAPKAYPGGGQTAIGDYNNDGKLDVVSLRPDAITLTLGDGTGRFSSIPSTIHPCGGTSSNEPSRPLPGDFNGDGKLDIALLMPTGSCVGHFNRVLTVFPGNGNGTFTTPVVKDISPFFLIPSQFAAADMNGDGSTDFICSTSFASGIDEIGIALSSGGGNFADPVEYPVGDQPQFTLTVGDFTSDSRPDIVIARRVASDLAIFVNNGSGAIGAAQSLAPYFTQGAAITAADFNNDGKLDIGGYVLNGPGSFQVWNGNGNGTVTAGANLPLPQLANLGVGGVIHGKVTADNNLDVVLLISGRMQILRGNGNGTFTADELFGVGVGKTYAGDFNNDGRTDIITAQTHTVPGSGSPNGVSDEFGVVLSNPDGSLATSPQGVLPAPGGSDVAIADLSNDGLKDLAVTGSWDQGEIIVLIQETALGSARPSFKKESLSTKNIGGGGLSPRTIAAADFNNDTKIDVVAAGQGIFGETANVLVAKNEGGGDLSVFGTMALGGIVTKTIAADLNGDNKQDLVFAQAQNVPAVSFGLVVLLGNGNGTFGAPAGHLPSVMVDSVASGDLNGDSRPDIALVRGNSVDLYLNNGSGLFNVGPSYTIPASSSSDIEMADMNGDGKVDVVASFVSDVARVAVFTGSGNGTLALPVIFQTTGRSPQKLTLADLDGDGRPEVATTNNGVVSVLRNDGSGNLTGKTMWFTTGGLASLTASDFDNDSKVDLVTSSIVDTYSTVGLMLNVSEAAPNDAPFDFDGDGKTDVGIYRPSLGEWWIYRSSTGSTVAAQFGSSTDVVAPADYTGDGKSDIAFFRPSSGEWFVLRSEDNSFYSVPFGAPGDIPAPADFDADGKSDTAVFRPSSGLWFIQRSSAGTLIQQFGTTGDQPIAADYDGDGRADLAIYRPGAGEWWLNRSTAGSIAFGFGNSSDKIVPGDYTGDGKTDVAFWRPSTGEWFILRSEDLSYYSAPFGTGTDLPAAGDYDGDGKFEIAVFRPSSATWFIQRTVAGTLIQQFGSTGDRPVANAFVR